MSVVEFDDLIVGSCYKFKIGDGTEHIGVHKGKYDGARGRYATFEIGKAPAYPIYEFSIHDNKSLNTFTLDTCPKPTGGRKRTKKARKTRRRRRTARSRV